MQSLEFLTSYLFFISILLLLPPQNSVPDTHLQNYRLLGDISIALQKSGEIEHFFSTSNPQGLYTTLEKLTEKTGFCITIASNVKTTSNCRNPSPKKFTQQIFSTNQGTLQTLSVSIQKQMEDY